MTLTLVGEPRSTNHVWKHSCVRGFLHSYMTPEGKALKESYQWQARSQYLGPILKGALFVTVTLYHGTRRRQDIDNYSKVLLDALTGTVWEDDSQVEELMVRRSYDKQNPRIELSVTELV
jgi:Holliday junction resolvase RusA-like endonuclease